MRGRAADWAAVYCMHAIKTASRKVDRFLILPGYRNADEKGGGGTSGSCRVESGCDGAESRKLRCEPNPKC